MMQGCKDAEELNRHLQSMLQRAEQVGIRLKLSKCTFCNNEVKWFGRVISRTGCSADREKINR